MLTKMVDQVKVITSTDVSQLTNAINSLCQEGYEIISGIATSWDHKFETTRYTCIVKTKVAHNLRTSDV